MPTARSITIRWLCLAVLAGVVIMLPIGYPFQLLNTFIHELGHYSLTVMTGGEVLQIRVRPSLGGHVIPVGGWSALAVPAGYMGTMIFAGFLLWCSGTPGGARLGLCILLVLIATYVAAAAATLGVFLNLLLMAFGAAFLLWSMYPRWQVNAVRFLGMMLLLDTVGDYYRLLFSFGGYRTRSIWEQVESLPARNEFYTDGTLMAAHFGGSEGTWIIVWFICSFGVLLLGLISSARQEMRATEEEQKRREGSGRAFKFKKGEGEHTIR